MCGCLSTLERHLHTSSCILQMKRINGKSIIKVALVAVAGLYVCQTAAGRHSCGQAATPAETLRGRLIQVRDSGKTLFGHHDDTAYGHSWSFEPGRSDVLETAGSLPAVLSWDMGGMENGDSLNLDGVPFDFIRTQVAAHHGKGGINVFSWHPRNPVDGNDSWTVADTTIVGRMMADPDRYRSQLNRLAEFFLSLTDADGNRIPVIFRPWHEHTGGWFFWGKPNCTAEQYAFLWKEMRRVFDSNGVDNILWAYSPDCVSDAAQYLERYPGDDMVDILGLDIYHFGGDNGTSGYVESADRGLSIIDSLASVKGKIPALTETGQESLTVAGWYDSILLPLIAKHHPAYVVVWRNAHDKHHHFYAPFKGHPSEESFRRFTSDPSIIMLNGMRQFN